MIKTEIIQLLETKQIWELSNIDLSSVKVELIRMARKCEHEQALRQMCDTPDRPLDTPLAEAFGG